jgi:IS30 family transposase
VIHLAAKGLTEREIVAATGVSKGSVWRTLHPRPKPEPVEWEPRPTCLTSSERIKIEVGLERGETFTSIAERLGRSVSTVSREVGGRAGRHCYNAEKAHRRARQATKRPKPCQLEINNELRAAVEAGLEAWWSPEQIAGKLRVEFPDQPEMWVSHETIYKSLFVQGRGALRKELTQCLRSGRAYRRSRNDAARRQGPVRDRIPISERPAEVEDRAVPGHWEGDLIYGAGTRHAIGTLVERTTRYVMLLHLPDGHSAERVRAAMADKVQELPASLVKTLTWDNGAEMAKHVRFSIDTGVSVYFCDPNKPWQRPTNENTNGLLRQYFPKGSDFSILTEAELDAAAASLNTRPRETLGWDSPAEALAKVLAHTP